MNPINLAPFCGQNDYRVWMNMPVAFEGFACATNGHIIIAVPSCVPSTPVATSPALPEKVNFGVFIRAATESAQDDTVQRLRAIDLLANLPPCSYCAGTGVTHETECGECDEGYFDHGSHEYECKHCDGSGRVDAEKGEGEELPCRWCTGSGRCGRAKTPGIGTAQYSVSAAYTMLLAGHLPDAEIAVLPINDNWFCVRSASTGAVGVVMAVRGNFA